jgi:glycerate 2-kinase
LKILIAPDKFKDSLGALKVCDALASGINRVDSTIEIVKHPLADGGEGTLKVLNANLDLEKVKVVVNDPLFRPIKAYYLRNRKTAFIEMAEASGLQRLRMDEYNPSKTSTFGTGELIKHAIKSGVKEINLFVGGSATNDGGIGIASALGCVFMTEGKEILKPTGEALNQIHSIDDGQLNRLISGINFSVLTDVKNVLFGKNGAAHVYAKQKGANTNQIIELDSALRHLAGVLDNGLESELGAGAAGGLGYGAMTFLNAELQSGVEFLMKITCLEDKLNDVDLIITGEGKLDAQSLEGKVVDGVLKIGMKHNIPIVLACGSSEISPDVPVYQVIESSINLEDAIKNTAVYLGLIGERIARDLQQPPTI